MSKRATKPKLSAFDRKVIKALDHIFTVEGWEIPDSAVEGKVMNKLRELQAQVNRLSNQPTSQRIDALAVAGKRKGKR